MTLSLGTTLDWVRRRRAPPPEKPFRDQLLSIERLEERAKALAARLTVDPAPRRDARDLFPRFGDNARALREAYLSLAEDVRRGEFVTTAAEWLLDNYHLIASEIRDVRQNLPRASTASSPSSPRVSSGATPASTPWPWSWSATATAASIGSSSSGS